MNSTLTPQDILNKAEDLRPQLESGFRDELVNPFTARPNASLNAPSARAACANGISTSASTAW